MPPKIDKDEKFKNLLLPEKIKMVCRICNENKKLNYFEEITNLKLNHKKRYFRKNCKKCQVKKRRNYQNSKYCETILSEVPTLNLFF